MPDNWIKIFAVWIHLACIHSTTMLDNELNDQSRHSFCNMVTVHPEEYNDPKTPFIQKFQSAFEGQQPVILKGGASDWAASSMWTIENLRDSADYASVRLSFNRAPLGRFYDQPFSQMCVGARCLMHEEMHVWCSVGRQFSRLMDDSNCPNDACHRCSPILAPRQQHFTK